MDAAPSPWRAATVVEIRAETARAKTFRFRLEEPSPYFAGQHYVVRLTAPDGYSASRSYSIASAPDDSAEFELTVERLEGGEVSTFLHDDLVVGDELNVRGPIGGWFAWRADRPALLIGGGSGVVPLMSMLRLARQSGHFDLVRLAVSVRTPDDLYYGAEIPGPETTIVYTRAAPPNSTRPPGRLRRDDLAPLVRAEATVYLCGSSGFADAVSVLLLDLEVPVGQIRVERFGATS